MQEKKKKGNLLVRFLGHEKYQFLTIPLFAILISLLVGAVVLLLLGKNPLDAYSFSESDSLLRPVNGDVVLKYSMDSTIYFESLNVYKCNPAISIAANVGDSVAVAADGIVQSVVDSEETKTTVTVGLGDGYEATYGLLDGVNVKSGDSVYKGQYLGTVAEPSAYYVKEGANLYFKLTKDGIPVNPMD